MELWYMEEQTPVHGITSKITQTLHMENTGFQDMAVKGNFPFVQVCGKSIKIVRGRNV